MNWKDKCVIKILLLVAKFISRDEWKKDVEQLACHINIGPWTKEEKEGL